MENKNFDHIVKSKLEEFEFFSPSANWDLFHDKYKDELRDTSDIFDKKIQEKFTDHMVPYNKKHWYLMKEALEREEFIRTSIYFSKIVEAGCIFLILFTFLNLFPSISAIGPESQENNDNKLIIADNDDTADQHIRESQEKILGNLTIVDNNTNHVKDRKIIKEGALSNQRAIINNQKPIPFNSNLNINTTVLTEPNPIDEKSITEERAIAFIDNPEVDQFMLHEEIESDFNFNENLIAEADRIWIDDVALLDQSAIDPLAIHRSFYIPLNRSSRRDPIKEQYISLAFAPTVNIVNSPFDYINKTEPYSTDALGGEIGFNYGVRRNNLEIETGLNYGRKSYEPKQVDEVTGSFFTSFSRLRLKQITYDVMSIPMNIKYHFKNGDGWGLYFLTGTSINGIANSDYLVEANGSKISIYDVQTNYRESNTAKKQYNPGILEGGNILDNLYFTLDLSFGVERSLNANTSFYLAPTLRQHLGLAGVGPNNDKVNSLGINLGIKRRL